MEFLSRCCCFGSLQSLQNANLIIGLSEIVASILCVAASIFCLGPIHFTSTQNIEDIQNWLTVLKYALCFFFGAWFFMGVLLLFGIVRRNERMILFRVVITAALLILATLGQIVGSVLFTKETGFEGATACVISGFLILGLMWYLWIVVYSYFLELNQGTRNILQ